MDSLLWVEALPRKTGVPNLKIKLPVLQLGDFVQDRDLRMAWVIGQQNQGDTRLGQQQGHRGPEVVPESGTA